MPHTTDVIRDRAIEQGIGASPLVGQAIQRRDIEQTRTLQQNVAASRALLASQREQRQTKFASAALRAANKAGQAQRRTPSITSQQPGISPLSIEAAIGPGDTPTFRLRGITGDRTLRGFESLRENLRSFSPDILQNIVVGGGGSESARLIAQLQEIPGIKVRKLEPLAFAQQVASLRQRRDAAFPPKKEPFFGLPTRIGGVRKGRAVTTRPTTGSGLLAFSLQRGRTLLQNEKARVVSAGARQFLIRATASSATSEDIGLRNRLLNALRTGRGFQFLQEFSRLGGSI